MPPLNVFARAPSLSSNVCNTTACIAASEYILAHVDLTVDPCSDFYQYTCGSWVNSPAVKKDYDNGKMTTESDMFTDENKMKQMKIIDGTYEDFRECIKSNATGFHLEDQGELDKANFEFYKSYYNVCKDINLYQSNQFTPIFEDIVMLQKQVIPLNATKSQFARAMAFFTEQSISILPFEILPSISFRNHNKREIVIANFGSLAQYTYDRESIVSLLLQVVGQPKADDPNAQMVIEASKRSGLELWSNNTISSAVDNHEKIASLIRNIHNRTSDQFDFSAQGLMDNPSISFDAVQQALPEVDLPTLLMALSEGLEADAVEGLHFRTSVPYLEDVNCMLSIESEKSIQDFLVVQYIIDKYNDFAPDLLAELSNNTAAQQHNATVSNTTIDRMKSQCFSDTSQYFSYGLSRYFGLETFGDDNDRERVLKFVEVFRESLIDRISNSSWLDDETKQVAINKMELVETDVAYSVSDPDCRDPTSIKQYYGNQTIDTRSYYHAKRSALSHYSRRIWKDVSADYVLRIWDLLISPDLVNAEYIRSSNSVAIYLGILRKPMYDVDFPEYLNFGNIGSIVAHEFVHGLDNVGKRFNGTGHLHDWWTPQATKEYEERQQCFIDEYSTVSIVREGGKNVYVDGIRTLDENIADIGGLSTAVDAYRKYINKERNGQPEPSLPGLEHLTAEQMLYISFGLFNCESIPPNHANAYDTDSHAPSLARTNPVVRNNENFAATFNCPADSPMNKKEKCHLW
ncbi:hypothetical protein EDC96DRAFT_581015 [Choanephora cucurbitarum]|nr:hypothetical protein EDC96DRAFT_581015 [Choanephora cucurbitarum]